MTVILATPAGITVALFLERSRPIRGKSVLLSVGIAPLLVPPAVLSYAIGRFFTPPGAAVRLPVGQLVGAALMLASCYWPLVALSSVAGLRQAARGFEEYALMHTGRWRTLWRVTLPGIARYLLAGVTLVFVLAVGEYSVPHLFGLAVYSTVLQAEESLPWTGGGAAPMALPLTAAVAALCLYADRSLRRHTWAAPDDGTEGRGLHLPSVPLGAGTALVLGLTVIWPMVSLAIVCGSPGSLWKAALELAGQVRGSFLVALYAALLGSALSLGSVLVLRSFRRIREFVSWSALCVLALPGALIAVGLVMVYNRPPPLAWVYGSVALPVLALAARFFYVPWRLSEMAVDGLDGSVLEAARMDGASRLRLLTDVVLPLAAPAVLAGCAAQFLLSIGEMSMSVLIEKPGAPMLAKTLLNQMHYGRNETVAASCLATMLLAVLCGALLVGGVHRLEMERRAR